jgi:hypothetical protein
MSEDETAAEPQPSSPFAPEDGMYQAMVSQYFGLQRAGADPLGAALITSAQIVILGKTATPKQAGGACA